MAIDGDWGPPDGGTPIDNQEQAPAPPTATPTTRVLRPVRDGDERTLYSYDRYAEAALLGAILYGADPDLVDETAWTLPGARAVHAAAKRMHTGTLLDARLVTHELGDDLDQLAVIDQRGALQHGNAALLALFYGAAATSSAPAFADIVNEHHRRRQLAAGIAGAVEHLRGGDIDATRALLADVVRSETTRTPGLTIHWVNDTLEDPPPRRTDLVTGMLRRGEITGVGAERNVGKSWFGMNLATLLARGGGQFLGHLPILEPARVLLCHGEMDREGAARRWEHLNGAYQPPEGIAETFDPWRLRVVERRHSTSTGGTTNSDRWYDVVLDGRVERTLDRHDIDVLIIDPWAVYYAGAENSNDEVEAALDKLRQLATDGDFAVVIFHHLRKAAVDDAGEPEDAWRGASRLPDGVNNRVTLLPHYTRKQAALMGMQRKQSRRYQDAYFLRRSGPAPDDISIAWNPQTGWWERWHSPDELGAERGGRPPTNHYNPVDVVDVCRDHGGQFDSIRVAADVLGLSTAGATTQLEAAVAAGLLEELPGPNKSRRFRIPTAVDDQAEEPRHGLL